MTEEPLILVVDDKPYIREMLAAALGMRGYRVVGAGDVREGFAVAQRERPAVILLDLILPGGDGRELVRRLRTHEETRAIPVIVMSARGDLDGSPPVESVQGYLVKPFDLTELEAAVARFAPPPAG
ncbi:MAG: response regulator [Clostridia bacterium]|nr:response regulator [Clostridia bacterium]